MVKSEAAARADVAQRVISTEVGESEPHISQVLAAARFVPRTDLGRRLVSKRSEVYQAVRRYGADHVVVFGRVAAGMDRPGSDVDLMVDIPDDMGLFALARMEQDVRAVLGVDVHVIPARLAKPEVLASAGRVAAAL